MKILHRVKNHDVCELEAPDWAWRTILIFIIKCTIKSKPRMLRRRASSRSEHTKLAVLIITFFVSWCDIFNYSAGLRVCICYVNPHPTSPAAPKSLVRTANVSTCTTLYTYHAAFNRNKMWVWGSRNVLLENVRKKKMKWTFGWEDGVCW